MAVAFAAGSASLQYIKREGTEVWTRRAGRAESSAEFLLADLLDDCGLEDLAVGTFDEHLVALEADWDCGAGAELAGMVAVGGIGAVLADIFGAVHADDDGGSASWGFARLAQDFRFGLSPVFHFLAGDFSGPDVDFFGVAAGGLVPVGGNGWPGGFFKRGRRREVSRSYSLVRT